MNEEFNTIKKFLEEVREENIRFKYHFYESTKDRPIDEKLVREYIKKTDKLLKAEKQPSKKECEEK